MPTRNIKRTYIGGTTSEARKKYLNWDKELTQIATNLAASYGVSPSLVIDRLAHEGLVDRLIRDNNEYLSHNGDPNYPSDAFDMDDYNEPYGLLGLDNMFDTYTKGITKTKRPINMIRQVNRNERGESVNSAETKNLYDTLELFVAELASRRNQVKKQYPNLTDEELDSATSARYNASNKYFKQLMDSGEYKSKYPINVKDINIPAPNKTDSKYIQDQVQSINKSDVLDAFKDYYYYGNNLLNTGLVDENTFTVGNKSYNPGLFIDEKNYEFNSNSPLVDRFIDNYINRNFTHPNKVQVVQEYKYGGRRKAQLGLDIREGGIAIPIANNMFYIDGRKHAAGGVAIGPNNKNGVEVEGGEVVEMIDSKHPSVGRQFKAGGQQQTMRVFSSVPFLRGASPAELVLGGANPDAVFKAQEEFKDRNRINDDGTRYEVGGNKVIKYENLPSSFKGKRVNGKILQGGVPPVLSRGELAMGNPLQRMSMWSDDLGEFSKYMARRIHKFIPKKIDKAYRHVVGYLSDKGPNNAIDNNAENLTKAISLFNVNEYKFGGNMIYTINGNVKNGLMASRPKAEWGKGKDDLKWRYASDPENFVRGYRLDTPYGKLYSDGTSYIKINGQNIWNTSPGYMDEAIKYQANKRPQYYAEKRVPIAGNQSIAEKVGLARSGWSYADSPTFDYVPNINISVPTNYAKAVGDNSKKSTSSTPRKGGTQSTATSRGTAKAESPKPATATNPMEARYASIIKPAKKIEAIAGNEKINQSIKAAQVVDGYRHKVGANRQYDDKNPDKNRYTRAAGFKAGEGPASPGNNQKGKDDVKDKDVRLIGQYKTFRPEDWLGIGTNLAGHIAGYFANNSLLKKYPMPVKPALLQAAKLKTTHNINPKLATSREIEQMNLAEVGRNTSSSSTSIARKQRIMNEARDARNKLYGEKENIETQLINLDRRNRQDVFNRNIAAHNDWLDKTYIAKTNKLLEKQKNMMSLINGIPGAVNHALGIIETRRNTNNTLRAIAAANPNVDARQIGGFDNYLGIGPDGKPIALYDKHQRLVRYI